MIYDRISIPIEKQGLGLRQKFVDEFNSNNCPL